MRLLHGLVTWILTSLVFVNACRDLPSHMCHDPVVYGQLDADDYIRIARDQTINIMTGFKVHNTTEDIIPDEYIDITYEDLHSNTVCDGAHTTRRHRGSRRHVHMVNTLATCPWFYRKNIDPHRRPRMMMEAVCACDNEQGSDVGNTCQSVYQYIRVFRQTGCRCGEYTYTWAWEKLSVACVSVRSPQYTTRINHRHRMEV